ncbi:MAG: BMP family ABC transporter substrate-binding protein [Clostridiales bacterium]|nr:BMP family ABC transporter substrate-binding protein [Clostridiales bacterium]MCF8021910.1 BMP family ABC transporter substrate-binding protein [Clostridiales bacterium]
MSFKNCKVILVAVLAVFILMAATGCSSNNKEKEDEAQNKEKNDKIDVGFMYVGSAGDAGWTYAHEQGRKHLENLDYVEADDYVESVSESAEAETVLTQLAEKGNDVIFSTSFGFMDYTVDVAKRYPDKIFMHCSGFKTADNLGTYFGRMYQARYLTGLVAGKTTESNLIGYVAAHPIPEVIRGINAFTLGVKQVNPDANVRVIWTHTWLDPAKEKDAAEAILDQGADVIAQHQDTPGPQEAAENAGAYGIGYNTDMSKFAPDNVLTSAVWNWGPYYEEVLKSVKNDNWESGQYWGSLKNGVIDIAPYGPMVKQETKDVVKKWRNKIENEEWDVFTGPIKNQNGEVKIKQGKKLTDKELLNMNWFVQGVQGKLESND